MRRQQKLPENHLQSLQQKGGTGSSRCGGARSQGLRPLQGAGRSKGPIGRGQGVHTAARHSQVDGHRREHNGPIGRGQGARTTAGQTLADGHRQEQKGPISQGQGACTAVFPGFILTDGHRQEQKGPIRQGQGACTAAGFTLTDGHRHCARHCCLLPPEDPGQWRVELPDPLREPDEDVLVGLHFCGSCPPACPFPVFCWLHHAHQLHPADTRPAKQRRVPSVATYRFHNAIPCSLRRMRRSELIDAHHAGGIENPAWQFLGSCKRVSCLPA